MPKTKNLGSCSEKNCIRPAYCKELCAICYERNRRQTNPHTRELHRLKSARSRLKPGHKDSHRKRAKKRRLTKRGYLESKYSAMLSRVQGNTNHPSRHVWMGLEICSRKDFYMWCRTQWSFHKLWIQYSRTRNIKIAPSIDRIDGQRGYVPENMQWITHSENSKKKG